MTSLPVSPVVASGESVAPGEAVTALDSHGEGEKGAVTVTKDSPYNAAEICRRNGWGPGTRLVGDEGYGPTVIEITAVGRSHILARSVSHNGRPYPDEDYSEGSWALWCRDWSVVT